MIVVAPTAEEFFFRGFFYRALRTRMGVLAAALLDGLLFGAIHYSGSKTAVLLPVLALLGFMFCLVYERTGTLFATIGLHALNNCVAYGAGTHEWGVAGAVGGDHADRVPGRASRAEPSLAGAPVTGASLGSSARP